MMIEKQNNHGQDHQAIVVHRQKTFTLNFFSFLVRPGFFWENDDISINNKLVQKQQQQQRERENHLQ